MPKCAKLTCMCYYCTVLFTAYCRRLRKSHLFLRNILTIRGKPQNKKSSVLLGDSQLEPIIIISIFYYRSASTRTNRVEGKLLVLGLARGAIPECAATRRAARPLSHGIFRCRHHHLPLSPPTAPPSLPPACGLPILHAVTHSPFFPSCTSCFTPQKQPPSSARYHKAGWIRCDLVDEECGELFGLRISLDLRHLGLLCHLTHFTRLDRIDSCRPLLMTIETQPSTATI